MLGWLRYLLLSSTYFDRRHLTIHSRGTLLRTIFKRASGRRVPLTQALGLMTTVASISKWLFLITGAYTVLCAPAILLAEHFGLRQSPLHISQFLAAAACAPSSAAFLWATRGSAFTAARWAAALALVCSALWVGAIVSFVFFADWPVD